MSVAIRNCPANPYLTALHENSDFGMVCLDDQLRILSWNPWIAERTGISEAAAVGKAMTEVIDPLPKATKNALLLTLSTGMPRMLSPVLHRELVPFIRPSLQTGRFFPSFDESGAVIGVLFLLHDATPTLDFEQFVQRRVLCEQKEREDIFNAMAHPAFILDPDHRILDVNRAMSELLNLPISELLGKQCFSLLDTVGSTIPECPMEVMREARSPKHQEIYIERLDKHFLVSCTPIFDPANRLSKVIHIAMDITEQKQIEAALRLSEERYRAFVKQSSEAICLFEIEHCPIEPHLPVEDQIELLYEHAVIRECNRIFANAHGFMEPNEMIGFRIGQVFPRLAPENVDYLRDFIQSGYHVSGKETKELARDGSVRYFLNSLVGYTEEGKLLRIWGAKQDITRIKRVEEEIRQLNAELEKRVAERTEQLSLANQELEAFAFSVSHDLRAPLRAIEGYTRILLEDHGSQLSDEAKRICGVIQSSTDNLRKLIEDLLAYSRAARIEMDLVTVDMHAMAYSIFHEATTPEERERIDLVMAPLPNASGDPTLLRQLWMNLLSNAVKFSAKKERACIEIGYGPATDPDGNVRYAYFVRDNGAGFDMRYAHKLFHMFQRLHSSSEFEGTGMGLAIVKRIVIRLGGTVWAEGEPGKGATFYVALGNEGR